MATAVLTGWRDGFLAAGEAALMTKLSVGEELEPACVRAPEGNGCAERFIRTLRENPPWVRHFETIEELCQAPLAFRQIYNTTWLIERHRYLTPADFHQKQLRLAAKAA